MEKRVSARLSAADGRKFGLTVGAAFLLLAAIIWWRAGGGMPWAEGQSWGARRLLAAIFGVLGLSLSAGGLLVPGHMGPIHGAWMGFALALSKVTTPIFMGVVYFVVLVPIGIVMRLLGRNPLAHGREGSAWISRDVRRGDLERQF